MSGPPFLPPRIRQNAPATTSQPQTANAHQRASLSHGGARGRSGGLIANLDMAILPAIPVPKTLANHTADRLFNVYTRRRRGSVVNWRGRRRSRERSPKQHSAEKTARYPGSDLTVLCFCGCWQETRAKRDNNDSRRDFAHSGSPIAPAESFLSKAVCVRLRKHR